MDRRPLPGALRAYTAFSRDARRFLLTTLLAGAALSLWWIDLNLYMAALGLSTATIGAIAAVGSMAAGIASFPMSALSDRVGRRVVLGVGLGAMVIALGLLLVSDALPAILLGAALFGIGSQGFFVVQAPYLTEHSAPEHRNELFAVQFAIQNLTNVGAAAVGGIAATWVAESLGLDPDGPGTYRVILAIMLGLGLAALASVGLLADDRPRTAIPARMARAGEPASFPGDPRTRATRGARFGLASQDRAVFVRLLVPGFLISLGAGQVIPFLNLFIQVKFGLDLASVNGAFALTSVGTFLAVMAQPVLARRVGQIRSVVVVQAASLPFLVVLGFSPVLWTVIAAMMVRNSLMNAGNPIFSAFAMERVRPAERATLSAAMSVLWQVGWVLGGGWYALLQGAVGFEAGYAVNFVTIIVLYATATVLYWTWFAGEERRRRHGPADADAGPVGG